MALQLFEPLKKALMVTPITFITNPHAQIFESGGKKSFKIGIVFFFQYSIVCHMAQNTQNIPETL